MENPVVLITGGGAGMGASAARLAAKRGARVAVADVDLAAADAVVAEITLRGGQGIAIRCDVADEGQVKAMVDVTIETYGTLDGAFNNAGIMVPMTETADVEEETYDRVMGINLKGVWLCMKYELLQMRKQGSGCIVNNSSIGGLKGSAGRAVYHAAKHGVLGLTKCAAVEYAPKGIRVNAVCPGTIATPMVESMIRTGDLSEEVAAAGAPIRRLGTAAEVAEAVLWLMSPASRYVIGQALSVDGGLSIV